MQPTKGVLTTTITLLIMSGCTFITLLILAGAELSSKEVPKVAVAPVTSQLPVEEKEDIGTPTIKKELEEEKLVEKEEEIVQEVVKKEQPKVVKKPPMVVKMPPVKPPIPLIPEPPKPVVEKPKVELEEKPKVEIKKTPEEKVLTELERAEIGKSIEDLEQERERAVEMREKLEAEKDAIEE
ncbi:MAG: hypothetical protein AB1567_11060, partial [bacterium]